MAWHDCSTDDREMVQRHDHEIAVRQAAIMFDYDCTRAVLLFSDLLTRGFAGSHILALTGTPLSALEKVRLATAPPR